MGTIRRLFCEGYKSKYLWVYLYAFLIIIIVVILLILNRWAIHRDGTKLTVGIGTWPGFCSGMVGKEKGLFEGIELEHKILDDAPARHAAFQNGNIDIMVSSVDVFSQEAAQGIKGKIFLITDKSFGGDGIVVRTDINIPSDLKGKKIAFAQAAPSQFLLYKVLQKNGLSSKDIEEIKVDDPSHAGQAFLGGSADAAVTWEPLLTEVRDKGKGHILLTTREYPDVIVDVLIASEKISQNPELINRFIKGWLKSVDYIKQHPDESAKIIANGLGTKNEDVKGMMAGLRFADFENNREFFNNKDALKTKLADILKDAANFWKSQQIITEVPNVGNLISPIAIDYFNESK